MIYRIVHLYIDELQVSSFQKHLNSHQDSISKFDGCIELSIFHNLHNPTHFTTFSIWESEDHLNAYRSSEFFKRVWQVSKTFFSKPPLAYSYENLTEN